MPPLAATVQPIYASPCVPPGHEVVVITNVPVCAVTVTLAVDVAKVEPLIAFNV
jgi:hypothetical protein